MFFRTERLFLRPGWSEDAAELAAAIGHADVAAMLANVSHLDTPDHADAYLVQFHPSFLPQMLITLPQQGGRIIGGCGLHDDSGRIAVSCWITPEHRGHGYAAEALCASAQVAWQCGHRQLMARHAADNPASAKVLLKAGFHPTGVKAAFHGLAHGHDVSGLEYQLNLPGKDDVPPPCCNGGGPTGRWSGGEGEMRAAA